MKNVILLEDVVWYDKENLISPERDEKYTKEEATERGVKRLNEYWESVNWYREDKENERVERLQKEIKEISKLVDEALELLENKRYPFKIKDSNNNFVNNGRITDKKIMELLRKAKYGGYYITE